MFERRQINDWHAPDKSSSPATDRRPTNPAPGRARSGAGANSGALLGLLLVLLLGLLLSCAPATEPEAGGGGPADSDAPADPATPSGPADSPGDTPPDGNPTDDNPGDSEPEVVAPVAPVEVDLGKLTPIPADPNATPVELPRPGVPRPEIELENKVRQDLARRLGLDVSDVTVRHTEAVDWSDSSLGCPAAGNMYLMVITPGYRIELEAQGDIYAYHTDSGGNFVLCGEDGRPLVDR